MARRIAGVIGGSVVPTTTAASGVWTTSQAAYFRAQAQDISGGKLAWPVAKDPSFSSVKLLCHFEAVQASGSAGVFVDSSGNNNHLVMNRPVSGTVNCGLVATSKFGRQSYFAGVGGSSACQINTIAVTGLAAGTGDFTIEGFFNGTTSGATQVCFDLRSATGTLAPCVAINTSNKLFYVPANVTQITGGTNFPTGQWNHVHVTRASGTTYMGMNGVQEGSDYVDSSNYLGPACKYMASVNSDSGFIGQVDEIRITIGVARYTRTYTVPTAPFPDY